MPDRASMTGRVRSGASRAKGAGEEALDRLTRSVEAAQDALKDLRKEVSRGTRDVLKDLETTLKDARQNLRSVSRTVSKDLQQVQQALTTGKSAPTRPARPRPSVTAASSRRRGTTATRSRGAGKPRTTRRRAPASTAGGRSPTNKAALEQAEPTAGPTEREPPVELAAERKTGSAGKGAAPAPQAPGQAAEETGSATEPVVSAEPAPEPTAEETIAAEAADQQPTT